MTNECKTVDAIVNALASVAATEQCEMMSCSDDSSSDTSTKIHHNVLDLGHIGKALVKAHLPRPKSENNFARSVSQETPSLTRNRPSFHNSDTFHQETSSQ